MTLTGTLTGVSLASLAATAGLLAIITAKNVEERGLRAVISGHEACATAVADSDLTASAARCSDVVAAVHRRAVQAAVCDQAVASGDLFVIRTACPTSIKTLLAQRDAATAERANLSDQLARTRADQAAAIARAETRGRTQTQRIQSVQTHLDAAPRADSGLGRCDADCLRQLAPGG